MRPKLIPSTHDTQKDAVYEWQWKFWHWNHKELSKRQVHNWVKWAIKKKFGFKHLPKIAYLRSGNVSWYNKETATLGFIHDHRNIAMVLHETAHAITDRMYAYTVEDHGPEFMGVFLWLLEACGWYPKNTLYASAKQAGLKIDGTMGPYLMRPPKKKKAR